MAIYSQSTFNKPITSQNMGENPPGMNISGAFQIDSIKGDASDQYNWLLTINSTITQTIRAYATFTTNCISSELRIIIGPGPTRMGTYSGPGFGVSGNPSASESDLVAGNYSMTIAVSKSQYPTKPDSLYIGVFAEIQRSSGSALGISYYNQYKQYEGIVSPITWGVGKHWNGTSWVDNPMKYWNGTSFIDVQGGKVWNGTSWQDL